MYLKRITKIPEGGKQVISKNNDHVSDNFHYNSYNAC